MIVSSISESAAYLTSDIIYRKIGLIKTLIIYYLVSIIGMIALVL